MSNPGSLLTNGLAELDLRVNFPGNVKWNLFISSDKTELRCGGKETGYYKVISRGIRTFYTRE